MKKLIVFNLLFIISLTVHSQDEVDFEKNDWLNLRPCKDGSCSAVIVPTPLLKESDIVSIDCADTSLDIKRLYYTDSSKCNQVQIIISKANVLENDQLELNYKYIVKKKDGTTMTGQKSDPINYSTYKKLMFNNDLKLNKSYKENDVSLALQYLNIQKPTDGDYLTLKCSEILTPELRNIVWGLLNKKTADTCENLFIKVFNIDYPEDKNYVEIEFAFGKTAPNKVGNTVSTNHIAGNNVHKIWLRKSDLIRLSMNNLGKNKNDLDHTFLPPDQELWKTNKVFTLKKQNYIAVIENGKSNPYGTRSYVYNSSSRRSPQECLYGSTHDNKGQIRQKERIVYTRDSRFNVDTNMPIKEGEESPLDKALSSHFRTDEKGKEIFFMISNRLCKPCKDFKENRLQKNGNSFTFKGHDVVFIEYSGNTFPCTDGFNIYNNDGFNMNGSVPAFFWGRAKIWKDEKQIIPTSPAMTLLDVDQKRKKDYRNNPIAYQKCDMQGANRRFNN